MNKIKKIFAITLSTAMLCGMMLSASAATSEITKLCSQGGCGQYNLYNQILTGTHCRMFLCEKTVREYKCSRCGTVYRVCDGEHYQ